MASGPLAKRIGRAIEAGLDPEEVRRDPAKAFETAMDIGRIVERGDTLSHIAQAAYGRQHRPAAAHGLRGGRRSLCERRAARGLHQVQATPDRAPVSRRPVHARQGRPQGFDLLELPGQAQEGHAMHGRGASNKARYLHPDTCAEAIALDGNECVREPETIDG
jgi:hypothetical protein